MTGNRASLRRGTMLLLLVAVLSILGACANTPPSDTTTDSEAQPTLSIYVSILPQRTFVERVGGDHVEVEVMVLQGESPATYEPSPDQLTGLSTADAYMSIGVPFERSWLDRIREANPDMMMVDTAQGIERTSIAAHTHNAGEEGSHEGDHEGTHADGSPQPTTASEPTAMKDPHIWLSPKLVKQQAATIADALAQLDPDHASDYQANLTAFQSEIDNLDQDIRTTLAGVEQRSFLVFHPSWGYFAEDYGLGQIAVEVDGQEPSAAELQEIISLAKQEGIKIVFAQPEFSTKAAETIATELGGEVMLINPLAPDWMSNMRNVAQTFERVLGREATP